MGLPTPPISEGRGEETREEKGREGTEPTNSFHALWLLKKPHLNSLEHMDVCGKF